MIDKIIGELRMFHRRKLYGFPLFFQVFYSINYRRLRRLWRWCKKYFLWGNLLLVSIIAWTVSCEPLAHRQPKYKQINQSELKSILAKPFLKKEDYQKITAQTGFSAKLIQALKDAGREDEIYTAQQLFFQPVKIRCKTGTILTREEYIIDESNNPIMGMKIPMVEEGDILVTNCSHCLGWRNGHAGIVVDADKRLLLEAQVLGKPSCLTSLEHWQYYPSFLVLRLKDADKQTRQAIAEYAKTKLIDIDYHLTAFTNKTMPQTILSDTLLKDEKPISGTQCAHLIWYAYYQAGYDLDSDGGYIVTPADLAESPLLEVIQFYGISY